MPRHTNVYRSINTLYIKQSYGSTVTVFQANHSATQS